ncbi:MULTISPECIES: hypothetical protein [unclassified Bradyrhizobium]|uniref:hypothetical protein n=1 Tax=unclassified Bradyrhizobium TaxID=2631580 RepID=UPI0020A13E41|nr:MULTISPECIES: hypothetical protein [unclassified Bradyrhizobium]MCP1838505.1 transposase-like protein [Bradyrhizobium sp. USDA 4538]MCP1899069.1 transposase-like protein [Bradyrhizobium sp. USDA 4537]MCP1986818.1 transposase-like protein [Bradyrhizobium sp. USDA 4539]
MSDIEGDKQSKKSSSAYAIGCFHKFHTSEGKLYLYVAIDRTGNFALVQLVKKTGTTAASAFL